MRSTLRRYDYAIPYMAVPGHSGLACKYRVSTNMRRSGEANLRT
jgi:hypothetical protein